MTLPEAKAQAQKIANKTGSSVMVYRSLLRYDEPNEYWTAFTLPMWGESLPNEPRIYPQTVTSKDGE